MERHTIGVIDLKTCVQAVADCSPELLSNHSQDYTVYAYDYTEFDTPLVGQGMLSWALNSPTPHMPPGQVYKPVTGRVSKNNVQGIFSGGISDTLEVKLRLTPVPAARPPPQAPPGYDQQEWYAHASQMRSQNNSPRPILPPQQQQQQHHSHQMPQHNPQQGQGAPMQIVNQLMSPSLQPQQSADPFNNPYQLEKPTSLSRPASPAGSVASTKSAARPKRVRKPRAPPKPKAPVPVQPAQCGNTSGYEEGTDGDEAPIAKRRATVSKANWKKKSSFGTPSDSLRVAASTAGSLRLFRPIAAAPPLGGVPAGSHLQEVPRAPTPVPQLGPQKRKQSGPTNRRNSILSQAPEFPPFKAPYSPSEAGDENPSQVMPSIEPPMTSPEKEDSPAETPPDISSSPPVLRQTTSVRSTPICPSSPILPPMPRTDSGFMSGGMSELFMEPTDRPEAEDEGTTKAAQPSARTLKRRREKEAAEHQGFRIEEVTPGPPELLPTKMLLQKKVEKPPAEPKPRPSRKMARTNSTMSEGGLPMPCSDIPLPTAHPLSRMNSVPPEMPYTTPYATPYPPPTPTETGQSSDAQPHRPHHPPVSLPMSQPMPAPSAQQTEERARSMSRSNSVSGLPMPMSEPNFAPSNLQHSVAYSDAPHPRTDGPTDRENSEQPEKAKRGTGMTRQKKSTKSRLELAIERGEMPPFCNNCGSISTPAWRRAWEQQCKGDPGFHEYSDQPGKTTAIDIQERDPAGKPTAFRLIKKALGPTDDKTEYTEILLCNPCGIWMSKYKNMRPEDRWLTEHNTEGDHRSKNTRNSRARAGSKKAQGQSVPPSEINMHSDAPGPQDRDMSGAPIHISQVMSAIMYNQTQLQREAGMQAPPPNPTVAPPQHRDSSADRNIGTRNSPIEVEEDADATPVDTTRRLLFPSPRKDGVAKVLGVVVNAVQSPTDFQSPTKRGGRGKENGAPPQPVPVDKEAMEDELSRLLAIELTGAVSDARPSTPESGRTTNANPFKTPTRKTPNHRPITRSVTRSATKSIKAMQRLMSSPHRSPSTLRRSPRHRNVADSPFTAAMNSLMPDMRSPSRNLDLGIDFSNLPDLQSDAMLFSAATFDPRNNGDFFSTDMPMPSSPPNGRHSAGFVGLLDSEMDMDPMQMTVEQLEMMDRELWGSIGGSPDEEHADEETRNEMGVQEMNFAAGLHVDENGRATFRIPDGGEVKGEEVEVDIHGIQNAAEEADDQDQIDLVRAGTAAA